MSKFAKQHNSYNNRRAIETVVYKGISVPGSLLNAQKTHINTHTHKTTNQKQQKRASSDLNKLYAWKNALQCVTST